MSRKFKIILIGVMTLVTHLIIGLTLVLIFKTITSGILETILTLTISVIALYNAFKQIPWTFSKLSELHQSK